MNKNIRKKTWQEFKDSGLLWWINILLHTFGWSIVFSINDKKKIEEVFPARVSFRGFSEKDNSKGYLQVNRYMNKNSREILKESQN